LVTEPHDLDLPPPYDEEFISAYELAFVDPLGDVTFRGERKEITIEEIIKLNGVRTPDVESSQKDFQVAFILLAMGEEEPKPSEIEKVEAVRRYWPPYFQRAVNNLATMVSTLDGSTEDVALPEEEISAGEFFFTLTLNEGLNIISPPLRPQEPFTARSLMDFVNSTIIIGISDEPKYTSWTMETPGDGFPIEGGRGYIVNTPDGGKVKFTGKPWSDTPEMGVSASPKAFSSKPFLWAFVIDGLLEGEGAQSLYQVTVQNLRTGDRVTDRFAMLDRFTLAFADLSRKPVVQMGDTLRLTIADTTSGEPLGKIDKVVTFDDIRKAYLKFHLNLIDLTPMTPNLFQNYPNPFNPETWIPFKLAQDASITINIYDTKGQLVRTVALGNKPAGFYTTKDQAAYWNGRDSFGERVASGVYFYTLQAGEFRATKKMVILK
jgi:hypothetical protein